jgi:hypothetical protein
MDVPANISLTRSLFYKILQICNLREVDKVCSKLVSSGLGKHKSLSMQTHKLTTESVHSQTSKL